MAERPPRVFISYSHDSNEHEARILALAEQLRRDGIDAQIDQYTADPTEGWPRWMKTQVKQADKVLMVFTETYQRRFEGNEQEGVGLGANFEGAIVTQELYNAGGRNSKFRAVVFTTEEARFIPIELQAFTRYHVDTAENYLMLLRWLHDSPAVIPGPLGQRPELPPKSAPKLFRPEPTEAPEIIIAQSQTEASVATRTALQPVLPRYEATFLGTFGGYQTIATGINDVDQIVGYSQLSKNGTQQHAFLYQDGELIDLNSDPDENGRADAINNHGQVVGWVSTSQSTYAFSSRNRQIIELGALITAHEWSSGSGINDLGEIVGALKNSSGVIVPFLYREGRIEKVAEMDRPGHAQAINDRGQVVGYTTPVSSPYRSFLVETDKFIDLGAITGKESQATGINNRGQIIGFGLVPNGGGGSFLYEDGNVKYLGGRSTAYGINDAGEIVGQSMDKDQLPIAFLWTPTMGLIDLNNCVENLSDGAAPGFTKFFHAFGINRAGNIAASGNYFDGIKTIQAACLLLRKSSWSGRVA
jgi:probable HAF family extracellular repeat protein